MKKRFKENLNQLKDLITQLATLKVICIDEECSHCEDKYFCRWLWWRYAKNYIFKIIKVLIKLVLFIK